MSNTPKNAYEAELKIALLDTAIRLFKKWHSGTLMLDPIVWSSIIGYLRSSDFNKEYNAFRTDIGDTHENAALWSYGKSLPSPEMCMLYYERLMQILEARQVELATLYEELKQTPKKEADAKTAGEIDWFNSKIQGLILPEGMPDDQKIELLPDYNDLNGRTRSCLKNDNIHTMDVLRQVRNGKPNWADGMLATPNYGYRTHKDLCAFLERAGITPAYNI